ncbi:hypothetical protein TNCV_3130721 [Trichonephila clavipes]|nr:hypothetical protein TNCV_3130721 [Trichonephila clavipes]
MKSVSFHSMWDVPKDELRRAKHGKERALSVDCLLPVLVYDAQGLKKGKALLHTTPRDTEWKWRKRTTGRGRRCVRMLRTFKI